MIMETGQMDGKVVVIGSLNYDIILKTDRMPLKVRPTTLKAHNAAAVEKAETRQYNVPN